ncbi:MAG TPA: hypothetical protein VK809_04520 [Bacteroidia bacterium]|jgi:hypothetical protein|nr:hypothetical protein [Bacteroidia bacterium]
MKRISTILALVMLFTGISLASSYQAKQDKPKTEKKADKKTEKKEVKKVPVRKTVTKKDDAKPAK